MYVLLHISPGDAAGRSGSSGKASGCPGKAKGTVSVAAHSSAGSRQAARALSFLYDINVRVAASLDTRAVADEVLDLCASRLAMKRGAVALLPARAGDITILSSRGISGEDFRLPEKEAEGFRAAMARGRGAVMILRDGAVEEVDPHRLPAEGDTRAGISFFCSPIPVQGGETPFLAVDRLFSDGTGAAEDFRLLSAAAAQLAPLFSGPVGGGNGTGAAGRGRNSLGSLLQQHITAWIMPMENTKRLRSDVYERLVGEVEKILIGAALEKTGYVQTEAARFLGINRNTLAKKIRRYGLRKKDR